MNRCGVGNEITAEFVPTIYSGEEALEAGVGLGAKSYDMIQGWFIGLHDRPQTMVICKAIAERADGDVENTVCKARIASALQSIANVEDNAVVGEIKNFTAVLKENRKSYRTLKRPYVGVPKMVKKANTFSMTGKRIKVVDTGYQFARKGLCSCMGHVLYSVIFVSALSVLALGSAKTRA